MNQSRSIAKLIIRIADVLLNNLMLLTILGMVVYGCYGIWDSAQIYGAADMTKYETYRPVEEDTVSFEELQNLNDDVFGWLQLYGTTIDYPLLQGEDNYRYVNEDIEGNFSLSGAIFLDADKAQDFSAFSNIIYGHHMEQNAMFGNVDLFAEEEFFNTHHYGDLYYGGQNHGLQILAYVETDAYNQAVYGDQESTEEAEAFLQYLKDEAVYYDDSVEVSSEDHLILMSTCDYSYTNGRMVLIAKVTDETYEDTFVAEETKLKQSTVNNGIITNMFGRPLAWYYTVLAAGAVISGSLWWLLRRHRLTRLEDRNENS